MAQPTGIIITNEAVIPMTIPELAIRRGQPVIFFGRKWSLYEGGICVPFIVQWNGKIPAGSTDSTTVLAAFDLFPSLCSLLEIAIPEALDSKD
jgi:hypothetical protein